MLTCSLATSSSYISLMETTLIEDMNIIISWSKHWLVKFNPTTTEAVFF